MTLMVPVGGRGWEEEGNTNTAAPAEQEDTNRAAEAMEERIVSTQGALGAEIPAIQSRPTASTINALRNRRAAVLNLEREHEELEQEANGAEAGSAGIPSPHSPTRRSPPFSTKIIMSPSLQRRLMWTVERTPLSRRGRQQKQHYRHVQRGRRPWAVVWSLMLLLLVLAMPLLQTWRRLWLTHQIGVQAAFVCIVSHFFPLVDHSDDFVNSERLAKDRRLLDLANHLNMAPAIAGTEDIAVSSSKGNHSIPVRLFRPLNARGWGQKKTTLEEGEEGKGLLELSKVLVWIHGGGWTIGSIESDDKIARRLAAATGAVVASVEYRLAPEFKYPAQLDDTVDALEFLLTKGEDFGLDTRKIAVAGESAGGHLTIVSAMALNSAKARLCGILPVVPATDYGCESASCDQFNDGFLLTQGQVRAFWNAKLSDPETEQHDFLVSPLRAPQEVFDDMPPMLVMTAGLDPLRDEGEAFVDRAREMGVRVELKRFEHTIHGFFGRLVTGGARGIIHAAEWLERTCEWGVIDEMKED
ncbi:esterase [Nannochloropsis oceanica]